MPARAVALHSSSLQALLDVLPGGCLLVVRPRLRDAVAGAGLFQTHGDESWALAGGRAE